MVDRFKKSWLLTKEAWAVLKQDRELTLFPVLSAVASTLVMVAFIVPVALSIPWNEVTQAGSNSRDVMSDSMGILQYIGMFLYYLATYFVVVFFNAGLVACVKKRFAGEDPTFADGMAFSKANIGRIFQWALLSATVGTILRIIEERVSFLGRIVVALIGLAWTLATLFVVPSLVYEGVGPVDALKRSAATFKKTWGELVIVNCGLGWTFGLIQLGLLLAIVVGIAAGAVITASTAWLGIGLIVLASLGGLIGFVALAIVQSTLQGIFMTACYEYATTGQVPSAFTAEYVTGAWRPK